MKYKLINTQIKEQHLCDKVTIGGFDYYVSDENPEPCNPANICMAHKTKRCDKCGKYQGKKVIATNNPNIDIPKVVGNVEIEELAWEEAKSKFAKEEGREPNINNEKDCFVVGILQEGIIHGYNKSQETHPFSEKNMIDFGIWCLSNVEPDLLGNRWFYCNNDKWGQGFKTKEELLKIWKEQQPKIVYYNG